MAKKVSSAHVFSWFVRLLAISAAVLICLTAREVIREGQPTDQVLLVAGEMLCLLAALLAIVRP